jgi:hypothetical protein
MHTHDGGVHFALRLGMIGGQVFVKFHGTLGPPHLAKHAMKHNVVLCGERSHLRCQFLHVLVKVALGHVATARYVTKVTVKVAHVNNDGLSLQGGIVDSGGQIAY